MAAAGLNVKKRILFVLGVFTFIVVFLLVRVAWIQFVSSDELRKKAYLQQTKSREITPKRGTILDRNGNELAVSASVEKVSVSPMDIIDSVKNTDITLLQRQEVIASKLSEILGIDKDGIMKKLTTRSRYEIIQRQISKETGDKIRTWMKENKIDGLYVDEDTKRFYPNNNLAAHVIGFTGIDNQGLSGVELTMDKYLKGTPGRILGGVDAGGRDLPFTKEDRIPAQDGMTVVLTIDETIQHLAEKALDKAIADNKVVNGATAIVLDPKSGEILALASKPDYNLNTPKAAPPGVDPSTWKGQTSEEIKKLSETVWRNKAVTDTYEPGSTFKAITSAAALEENVIKPDSRVTDKTVTVAGWNINCWKPNAHIDESFTEGVYNSCNPVFVRVAQSMGVPTFYKYVKAFGFYDKTGIELPGEAKSIFHKKPAEIDMASASFGQRFQITPIQLITAYGAVANGGKLIKPTLIKEIRDSEGNVVKKSEAQVVRNVISEKTASTLREILEGVVSEGTGGNAYVKGFRIAGKTGTSQTTEENRYIASFSAFAPADNPVVNVLIALDNPQVYPHSGGMIGAPVAGKLTEDILSYMNVERRYTEKDKEMMLQEVIVPDVRGKNAEEAKKIMKDTGLEIKLETKGSSDIIQDQIPKPNASVPEKSVILLYTYKPDKPIMVKVPDVSNKTITEATKILNDLGLNIKANGLGIAVNQLKKPGEMVQKGELIEVEFKNLYTD